jgi:hypothetical protein
MIRTPSATLASASALVGSSNTSPLMKTTSAVVISSAADGGGSKVCEFVPSGTTPVISAQSPITFAAIDVIGATVVTTWNAESPCDASSAPESSLPQAVAMTASAVVHASSRRTAGRIEERSIVLGDMAGTVVATWSQIQFCRKNTLTRNFEHRRASIRVPV